MAEPVHAAILLPGNERHDPERAPLDAADFPGCRPVSIPRDAIEEHEGRVEYWEACTETAMVVREPTTSYHERPSHRLSQLAGFIAAARGSAIEAYGTTDLVRYDARGKPRVLMQADQILYLHPPSAERLEPRVDIDGSDLPDVVLEVDYSTDVRVRKLPLYEAWGFPEVWVEVPDARSRSRPKSRASGLTIHVLEGGSFRTAENSRAFPGWTAEEIHRALNEHAMSASTEAALHRAGAALGAREGTGPDDDLWLRRHRDEGRAEGLAQGRDATRHKTIAALLEARGIRTTAAFGVRLAELGEMPESDLVQAALRCESEAQLLELCARKRHGTADEDGDS